MSRKPTKSHGEHVQAKPRGTVTAGKPNHELTDAELDQVAGGVGIVSRRVREIGLDKLAAGVAVVKRTRN